MEAESVERLTVLLELSIKDKKYEALLILTVDRNFNNNTVSNLEKALNKAKIPIDVKNLWTSKVADYRKLLAC